MSDPIHSWVDPQELRRIGELLMSEPHEIALPVAEDAVYGSAFEGFGKEVAAHTSAVSAIPATAVKNLAEAKRLAEAGGLLSQKKAKHTDLESTSFLAEEVGVGPFLKRLGDFARWLRQEVSVERFFLLDQDGDLLVDEIENRELVTTAYELAKSSRDVRSGSTTSLGIEAFDGKIIEVIPATTHYGFMILGLLVNNRINPESARIVEEGLVKAVQPLKAP